MPEIPECFCDQEAMASCDWQVEISAELARPSDPNATKHKTTWVIENVPHALGQIIVQANVAAVNEQGWGVYTEWLTQCLDKDDPIVERLKKAGDGLIVRKKS